MVKTSVYSGKRLKWPLIAHSSSLLVQEIIRCLALFTANHARPDEGDVPQDKDEWHRFA